MNKLYIGFFAMSIMLFNLIAVPSGIYAQGMQDNPSTQQTPNDTGTLNSTDTQTGTTTEDDNSWLWWLLPLLAIPVIFMLTRKNDNRGDNRNRDSRMAGVKGGSSRRDYEDYDR